MSATFSINVGTITESTRKADIFSVLNDIPDNTQKLISPRDVRDAILSTWANSPFKLTSPNSLTFSATFSYIGLDSSDPANRDIKLRILLGKRNYGNLDVLSTSLLNTSDADIFLYNTKPTESDTTKVAILAGTNSALYINAPYIESKVNTSNNGIDLSLVNPANNGAINLKSETGRVAINGIIFPTVAESTSAFATQSDSLNGKILRYHGTYPNGYLEWVKPDNTINIIGSPGFPTNIYGSTVKVNGYSLEFVDTNYVPKTLGGVTAGSTFATGSFTGLTQSQNWPLTEVLKKILYPYIEPVLSLSTDTLYAESGKTTSSILTWSISTYERTPGQFIYYGITPSSTFGLSFSGIPGTTIGTTLSVSTFSTVGTTKSWVLKVSNSSPSGFSFSATASISFINPIFYGFGNTSSATASLSSLSKLIKPYPGLSQSYSVDYNGSGYLYFIYPGTFNSNVIEIQDPNGNIIHLSGSASQFSSFTFSSLYTFPSYTGTFSVFRTNNWCSWVGEPNKGFKFIF
jgi:hypothetical protein